VLVLLAAATAAAAERDDANNRLVSFDDREEELFRKLHESDRIRRDLHAKVMQLSGNIRVFVRVRPELPGEKEKTSHLPPAFAQH
jgi:histidinol-phosphate/aromatic aminotransferase/cobyric acid decarboxylase-like protein